MALFRCLRSGRTVEFTDPEDIEKMKDNESYVKVSTHSQGEQDGTTETKKEVSVQDAQEKVLKKLGRPRKEVVTEI